MFDLYVGRISRLQFFISKTSESQVGLFPGLQTYEKTIFIPNIWIIHWYINYFTCLQTYEMAIFICLRFFLFKTYESYVGKIHMFANIWNGHFHMFEICLFSKHMSYMLGKFICFTNIWNGHFHMFEIFLFSKHMSYMLVKFTCLQNIWKAMRHAHRAHNVLKRCIINLLTAQKIAP